MKVYLLLRNNRQSGPYSLEELVQQRLKPNDLIWVEGRSSGWAYPFEIDALKPYCKGPDAAQPSSYKKYFPSFKKSAEASKKVFVSLPAGAPQAAPTQTTGTSLEQKAEELRRRALAAAHTTTSAPTDEVLETRYARSLDDVEESYTSWVYNTKTKKKTVTAKQAAEAAAVLLVLVIVFVLVKNIFYSSEAETAAGPVQAKPAAALVHTTTEESAPPIAASAVDYNLPHNRGETTAKEVQNNSIHTPVNKTARSAEKKPAVKMQEFPASVPEPDNTASGDAVVSNEPPPVTADNNEGTAPVKKKKLGERIGDFFDKMKRKDEAKPAEEPQPPTGTAERKATRRGEEAAASVNLAEYVEVTANEAGNNWMMGVHGLKLTLKNRSSETVKTASVEVQYLNEDDEVLDKKIVTVSNVPPKKSVTVAAPDHRLASRTTYRLLSAN